jgi:hypothetical protein
MINYTSELHFDKPAKYWATVISNPDIPLYTHPAKTLTDEEILIEAKYQPNLGYYLACEYDILDFARAILKKAYDTETN